MTTDNYNTKPARRRLPSLFNREMFIIAIGAAAYLHSLWSFGTFLGGAQPDPLLGGVHILHYLGWLIPAMLLAFALDVGMIKTSQELRKGKATFAMYAAFGLLATITYTLQWLYSVHHMSAITIGAGVPVGMRDLATNVSNFLTVWLLPGALPITAIAYTFASSDATEQPRTKVTAMRETTRESVTVEQPAKSTNAVGLPTGERALVVQPQDIQDAMHVAKCTHCGWEKRYVSPRGATNALTAHHRGCKVLQEIEVTP